MKENDIRDKKAVAIEYSEDIGVPRITAKGEGYVAEKIIEKAQEHGVEMYYDEELLKSLMAIAVGEEIPKELYEIVAKVLLFVERVDGMYKGANKK